MDNIFLATGHFLAAFAMVAILAVEMTLIRPGITSEQVVRVRRLDGFYGSLIGLILFIGILQVSTGTKGQDFYTDNPVFWLKMAAFALVGILSIPPTIRIYYWWQQARGGAFFSAPEEEVAKVRLFLKLEAAVFATIPGFAVAAASGVGL